MTVTDLCYVLSFSASPAPSNITQAYNALVVSTVDWMLNDHSQPPSPFLPPSIESRTAVLAIPTSMQVELARVH